MSKKSDNRIKVRNKHWLDPVTGQRTHSILIHQGSVFIKLNMDEARSVVDKVHDRADEYEAQQRKEAAT